MFRKFLFLLTVFLLNADGKLPQLQSGLWEFSSETAIPGINQVMKHQVKVCIKEGDLREFEQSGMAEKAVKPSEKRECDIKNIKNPSSDQVEYQVVCDNQEGYLLYKYKFTKTSLDGSFRLVAPGLGDDMPATRLRAKWIGECKK